MSCWTLWQRMPTRYQLTMRDSGTEDQEDTPQVTTSASRASSASPRSPRLRTPRGARRVGSASARLSTDGAVLTSGVVPEDQPSETDLGHQAPVLPPRSSPYINNMKNQMRINSARRKMDERSFTGTKRPTATTTTTSYIPKARATTAPAFPITKASNTNDYHRLTSPRSPRLTSPRSRSVSSLRQHEPQRGFSGRRSPRRPSSSCAAVETTRLSISNIAPFGEQRDFRPEGHNSPIHQRASPRQQDCVIGDYQVAALYVDRGRVTFFRKTKPDVTQSVYSAMSPYQVTRDDGSYLAHLRKAYLSGVRDLPKVTRKEPELEKHTAIRERMDYDRKVGRILDYYAKVDISREVQAPRPPDTQHSKHHSTSLPPSPCSPGRQGFRTINFRRKARGATKVSEVIGSQQSLSSEGTEFTSPRGPLDNAASPRDQGDQFPLHSPRSDGFVRINSQVRLHDRHRFYLRTPAGQRADPTNRRGVDQEYDSSCVCGMCRLEKEVALMAQLHRDLGVSVDAATAAQIRVSLEDGSTATSNALAAHAVHGQQGTLGAVAEEAVCPTRPNSVCESRCPTGAPEDLSPSNDVGPAAEPQTNTYQLPGRMNALMSTQTPPATEATSLTVTLPAIEEGSEATQADRAVKGFLSEGTDDNRTVVMSEPSVHTESTPPDQCEIISTEEQLLEKKEKPTVEKDRHASHSTVDIDGNQSDPKSNEDSVSPVTEAHNREKETAEMSEPDPDVSELMPEQSTIEKMQSHLDDSKSCDNDDRISEEPQTGSFDEDNNKEPQTGSFSEDNNKEPQTGSFGEDNNKEPQTGSFGEDNNKEPQTGSFGEDNNNEPQTRSFAEDNDKVLLESSGNVGDECSSSNADCYQSLDMETIPDSVAGDSIPETDKLLAVDTGTTTTPKDTEEKDGGSLNSIPQPPQIVISAASDSDRTSSDDEVTTETDKGESQITSAVSESEDSHR